MKELKKIDVYLIAGQSNAVGLTKIETLPKDFEGEVFDRVLLYQEGNFCLTYYGQLVRGVRLGMGCDTENMGIEYNIAKYLQENTTEEVAIIRYAFGGSNLFYDWKPRIFWDGEPQIMGHRGYSYKIWAQTVANGLNKLLEAGYLPQIKALAWMQGESDADKGEAIADMYYDNLCDLIYTMRAELRMPELPVVIGEIAVQAPVAPWADTVRAAQSKFVLNDAHAALVSTKDIPAGKDNLHFDGPEALRLGQRFVEALLSVTK